MIESKSCIKKFFDNNGFLNEYRSIFLSKKIWSILNSTNITTNEYIETKSKDFIVFLFN